MAGRNKLVDIETREVSLVDRAANKRKFLVQKQEKVIMPDKDDVEKMQDENADEGQQEMSFEKAMGFLSKMDMTDEQKSELLGLMPQAEEKAEEVEEESEEVDIEKAEMPEGLKAQFKALQDQNKEAVEKAERVELLLKAEQDKAQTKEFIAKAETFTALGCENDKLGTVLKNIANAVSAKDAEYLDTVLKTANETVAKSALMDELGVSGESGSAGDAMEKLDSLAKQLVEKDTSLTSQQAFAQVLKSNPDLYNQYRNEKKGGK
jgi:hypothetical protein